MTITATRPVRRTLLALAALASTALVPACSAADAPAPGTGPTTSPITQAEPQFSHVDEGLGHSFDVIEVVRDVPLPADAHNAGNVGELIAVRLNVEAGTEFDNVTINPSLSFTLIAPGAEHGQSATDTYDDIVEAAGYTPLLTKDIEAGTSESGWIVVPVRDHAQSYELQYRRGDRTVLGTDTTLPAVDLRILLP